MKLISVNKAVLFLFIFVFAAVGCMHINEGQMATGRWQFIKITNNDSALYRILDTDFLELESDSSFHYEITSANKNMSGKWQYKSHQLFLTYIEPDTTRVFDIEILSARDLVFNEGSKHFVLKRLE